MKRITLFVTLVLLMAACDPGPTNEPLISRGSTVPQDLVLILEAPKEMSGSFAKIPLRLRFKNASAKTIGLDKRILSPVLIVEVRNRSGELLPNVPPSVPKEFTQQDVLILEPGKEVGRDFTLEQINMDAFRGFSFRTKATYDTSVGQYPSDSKIWKGKVESNELVLK